MNVATERRTLSVIEAGRVLGLGKEGAYAAVHRGDIPAIKVGRRWLVPVDGLERLLVMGDHHNAEPQLAVDVSPPR